MAWVKPEGGRIVCCDFADIFVRCQAAEGFEPSGESAVACHFWVLKEWEGDLGCLRSSNTTKCVSELANLQIFCRRSELAFKANTLADLAKLTH